MYATSFPPEPRELPPDPGLVRVLPAQDPRDGDDPVVVDRAARPAQPQLRLGHLRRRRLDPGAHPQHRVAPGARDRPEARRPPHLRGRHQGRGRRGGARLSRGRRAPHRGHARRPGGTASATAYAAHPGGLRALLRPRRRHQAHRRLRGLGPVGLSGAPTRGRFPRPGSRRAEGQGRLRRRPRHHPVLLRQRPVLPLPRPVCRRAASIFRSSPASCRCRTSMQAANFASRTGASVPDWLAARFEGLDDDVATRSWWPRRSPPSRCSTSSTAASRFPLLHHEPRRPPRLRDLPPAGGLRAAPAAAENRRRPDIVPWGARLDRIARREGFAAAPDPGRSRCGPRHGRGGVSD